MSKQRNKTKFMTPEILKDAVIGAFKKLNPRYMMKNPVMFVVEIGCLVTLVLSVYPGLFGIANPGTNMRAYNIIVTIILFITGCQPEKNAERYKSSCFNEQWK